MDAAQYDNVKETRIIEDLMFKQIKHITKTQEFIKIDKEE